MNKSFIFFYNRYEIHYISLNEEFIPKNLKKINLRIDEGTSI